MQSCKCSNREQSQHDRHDNQYVHKLLHLFLPSLIFSTTRFRLRTCPEARSEPSHNPFSYLNSYRAPPIAHCTRNAGLDSGLTHTHSAQATHSAVYAFVKWSSPRFRINRLQPTSSSKGNTQCKRRENAPPASADLEAYNGKH